MDNLTDLHHTDHVHAAHIIYLKHAHSHACFPGHTIKVARNEVNCTPMTFYEFRAENFTDVE